MTKGATRMELRRIRDRLATARRGHKMLKDKSDEAVRRLVLLERRRKALAERVQTALPAALSAFALAGAECGEAEFAESLLMPARPVRVTCASGRILSVAVPELKLERGEGDDLPYGFASMPAEADLGAKLLSELLPVLLELAQVSCACRLLEEEIRRTKRRVNALEYVMIPESEREAHAVLMKLEENERAASARLMKLKGSER